MSKHAVYAGTFDPVTNGHRDIVLRALRIFDKLTIAVAAMPKKQTLFSAEERAGLITAMLQELDANLASRIQVSVFDGLLVDYVRSLHCNVVIRGLRAVSDYEYEAQMAVINRHLDEAIETVFLMTSEGSSFISSSVVREIAKLHGDVSGLVPRPVSEKLAAKFSSKS